MKKPVDEQSDFIAKYLAYTSGTEVPMFFNRWSCIVGLGAWAAQDVWFEFRDGKIYPNIYAMLIGDPGTRKSTAIKTMKNLLKQAGYNSFASEGTSKEKFLEDLASAGNRESISAGDLLEANLFGSIGANGVTSSTFIAADEFNNFFSNNILNFVSVLGELWDFSGVYENRIKNGQSVSIANPNVSILGGNTVENFNRAFPPEIMGQGFLSRLLLVYGERTVTRIAFPHVVSQEETDYIVDELIKVRDNFCGKMDLDPEAKELMEFIYNKWRDLADPRFMTYSSRRFTHLIKLVMIHAIADCSPVILPIHVRRANTVLVQTEYHMPKALGEMGRSRNSIAAHKIMQLLDSSNRPLDIHEIWSAVMSDVEKVDVLGELMRGLVYADRVEVLKTGGFVAKKAPRVEMPEQTVDWSYLTREEKGI